VLHANALHGNSFHGHTLGPAIAELEKLTGVETRRFHVDKSYRARNHSKSAGFGSGRVRRVTFPLGRKMKHRAAVELVIGHRKAPPDGPQLSQRMRRHVAAGYQFALQNA
jgi:IS5 family transposase